MKLERCPYETNDLHKIKTEERTQNDKGYRIVLSQEDLHPTSTLSCVRVLL